MIQLRNNLFETNSSSTHSVVISKKDRGWYYDLPVDENGVLTIKFGEFGWGPEILRHPMDKLSYWITDHAPHYTESRNMTWDEVLIELKQNKYFQELEKLIKSVCPQVKEIQYARNGLYYQCGYVDHESCGTSYVKDLLGFIFNNAYAVVIDNDNNNYFKDYFPDEYIENSKPKKDPERLFEAKTFEELMQD